MPLSTTPVAVGTRTVGVRRLGDGPPIFALHGFPQTSACWEPIAERLSDRFELVLPDLPGIGASDPAASADAREVGAVLIETLDALGLDRVTLVGHDFGGAIAWRLALTHPERFERLVIVNSPFRRLDFRRGWHMLFLNLPLLPELAFTAAGGTIIERSIRACVTRPDAITPEAMQEYQRAFASLERQRNMFAYYRTVTRRYLGHTIRRSIPAAVPLLGRPAPSPQREQRKIEVPTMVVWGVEDPVLPVDLTKDMHHHVTDLRLELLEGVGHFVPEEAPDALAALIADFAG